MLIPHKSVVSIANPAARKCSRRLWSRRAQLSRPQSYPEPCAWIGRRRELPICLWRKAFFLMQNTTDMLFYANGVSYVSPNTTILLQILTGAPGAMDLMPAGSIHYLPPNKSIEITMPALPLADPGHPHPFHLHGVRSHHVNT